MDSSPHPQERDIGELLEDLREWARLRKQSGLTGVPDRLLTEAADTITRLRAQPSPREMDAEFDANVDRLKACEHIADGDEGWERLRNECPSTAAVARLRDAFEKPSPREAELQAMDAILKRVTNTITSATVASCRCNTKTPDPAYHEETCCYRRLEEALSDLRSMRFALDRALAPEAQKTPKGNT